MQEADVDLDGLDWIVCHSGADIWHGQQDGQWEADDHWEQLIDFRHAHAPSCTHTVLRTIASMASGSGSLLAPLQMSLHHSEPSLKPCSECNTARLLFCHAYSVYVLAVLPETPVRSRHADQYGDQENEEVDTRLPVCNWLSWESAEACPVAA